jgi:peptide/nickel transport system substrate-binding protein
MEAKMLMKSAFLGAGRRTLLASLLMVGVVASTAAQSETVLRLAPQAALTNLDSVISQTGIALNHSYMIYDTLFAMDAENRPQPQMVEKWHVSPDGLLWEFTLRPNLKFSEGTAVTARDVVASIRRWAPTNAGGKAMMARAASLEAVDERTVRLHLKKPYGLALVTLSDQLGPFVLREKDLQIEPGKPITESIGSGPFIFLREAWDPGGKAAYRENPAYVGRSEPPSAFAGNKEAKVDRVEWTFIPDAATAVNALIRGEIDIYEQVPPLS